MEIDPNIYIRVLVEQRNQALNAAALLQVKLLMVEKELKEFNAQKEIHAVK